MLNLGSFEKDDKTGKITGTLYGVNMVPTKLIFEPTQSKEGKLYYSVFAQCQQAIVEAGAAWPKESRHENGKPYIDIKLDSPSLASTFYGRLSPSDVVLNTYQLTWMEPKSAPKAEAKAAVTEAPTRRHTAAPAP